MPCGAAWGHNGDWVGYNSDEEAFTPAIGSAIFALASTAYCR
jgi:hypothetical protein